MLLCIDIGNTNIVLGLHGDGKWLAQWRIRTAPDVMPDEYAMLLKQLLADRGCSFTEITMVTVASVVPPLTGVFSELCQRYLGKQALIIGPGVRTGMRIRIDNPAELGADLVCDAVAAYQRFGTACIVVDFGTATTFSAIAKNGDFLGVAIALGLGVAADALAARTAQLPRVHLIPPPTAIGKNTVHSMQSGLIFGYVGLVESLIARIQGELGGHAKVIATGGLAPVIASLTHVFDEVDPWLTLEGIRIISERNASEGGLR
ncbi:MAG: type III pantothenate kinase [Chloroflexi bacterium]|nr:type III pantothenate kinase [Chloroflexota bacterium]